MRFAVVLALLVLATPLVAGNPVSELEARVAAAVRPVVILKSSMFKDGGTTTATLQDAKGVDIEVTVDGRMSSEDPGALWVGGHPAGSPPEAKVPANSPAEAAVVALLKECAVGASDKFVASMIATIEQHAAAAKKSNTKPLTRAEAIEIARKSMSGVIEGAAKIDVQETPQTFVVRFVDIPFTDDGKKKLSTMNVTISRTTSAMLSAMASDVRDAP